jgi:tRNA threonylcarbamoyl adenosine modification protein YeaZ
MYTLALDTTSYKIHFVLFKNDTPVFERDWRSEMNEDETITKTLHNLTQLEPFYLQKLSRIIINEGPGTLTGTRIGVAIANALSFACKAPLVKLNSHDLWKLRLREEDRKGKPHLLIRITEQELYVDGKIIAIVELLKVIKKEKKREYLAYGELTPTQFSELNKLKNFTWIIEPDLLNFTSAVSQIRARGDTKYASPKYARPPVITMPKQKSTKKTAKKSGKKHGKR